MQISILLDILKTVERETFVHSLVHFPNDHVETRSLELHTGLPLGPSAFPGTFKQRARIGGKKNSQNLNWCWYRMLIHKQSLNQLCHNTYLKMVIFKIYLLIWKADLQGGRLTQIHRTRIGPSQTRRQEFLLGLPHGRQHYKLLNYLSLLLQVHLHGYGLVIEQPRLKPLPIWNTGVTGNRLSHYTTVQHQPQYVSWRIIVTVFKWTFWPF